MNEDSRHHDAPPPQEEDDVPWGRVLLAFLATFALMAALIVAAWASLKVSEDALRPRGVFPERDLGPRREVAEVQEDLFSTAPGFGELLNDQKRRALSTYGWVDEEQRIVRIPIDQAMDILVEAYR